MDGKTLEDLLVSIIAHNPGIYGVPLHREIRNRSGEDISLVRMYSTLDVLEKRKLIHSWDGEATPERGGCMKRHFAVGAR